MSSLNYSLLIISLNTFDIHSWIECKENDFDKMQFQPDDDDDGGKVIRRSISVPVHQPLIGLCCDRILSFVYFHYHKQSINVVTGN